MRRDEAHQYFGLKWNPFQKDIPVEGMVITPKISKFCWRIENLVMDGGYGMLTGAHGLGKSAGLRILEQRLSGLREVQVGVLQRPQSSLADFYRELGHMYGIDLVVSNRWGCFRELRRRWQSHIETTLLRPVLIIDEAQEVQSLVLNELRFLASERFDSRNLLSIILAGDDRLPERFRQADLQPLGSRIAVRLVLEPFSPKELSEMLQSCLEKAGNPGLITKDIIETLAQHAAGIPRIMMNMALELMIEAFKQEAKVIDERIYLKLFSHPTTSSKQDPRRKRPHDTASIN